MLLTASKTIEFYSGNQFKYFSLYMLIYSFQKRTGRLLNNNVSLKFILNSDWSQNFVDKTKAMALLIYVALVIIQTS